MKEMVTPPVEVVPEVVEAPRRLETSNDWHTWSTDAIVNDDIVEGTSRVKSV